MRGQGRIVVIQDAYGYRLWRWQRDGRRIRVGEHRIVWESKFGPIPQGYLVHHKDGCPEQDDIGNLQCVTRQEHARIHMAAGAAVGRPRMYSESDRCVSCGAKPATIRSRCKSCYNRWWRTNGRPRQQNGRNTDPCACGRITVTKGMCSRCYQRSRRNTRRAIAA
jgi:hypothetical protein